MDFCFCFAIGSMHHPPLCPQPAQLGYPPLVKTNYVICLLKEMQFLVGTPMANVRVSRKGLSR